MKAAQNIIINITININLKSSVKSTEDDHVERAGLLLVEGGDLALVQARVFHCGALQAHAQSVTRVQEAVTQF